MRNFPRRARLCASNPVKGSEFSQESGYEALALEVEDTFALLGELRQPEYELAPIDG